MDELFHAFQEPSFDKRALAMKPRSFPAKNHPLDPTKLKSPCTCVPPAGISIGAFDLLVH
jgi:hypothetical protein